MTVKEVKKQLLKLRSSETKHAAAGKKFGISNQYVIDHLKNVDALTYAIRQLEYVRDRI